MTTLRQSMERDAVRRGLDPRTARAMETKELSWWLYETAEADDGAIRLDGLAEVPPPKRRRRGR